jgi:hypothetical protein
MSKDKGVKNNKKSVAVKTSDKDKAISSYKAEGKSEKTLLETTSLKSDKKGVTKAK